MKVADKYSTLAATPQKRLNSLKAVNLRIKDNTRWDPNVLSNYDKASMPSVTGGDSPAVSRLKIES